MKYGLLFFDFIMNSRYCCLIMLCYCEQALNIIHSNVSAVKGMTDY